MVHKKDNPTIQDVLEAISDFAHYVQGKFEGIDGKFEGIEQRLTKIEETMVTKDYLDEKLADFRGDMVVLVRKEDTKLTSLISLLAHKNVLSKTEERQISNMEPFAH